MENEYWEESMLKLKFKEWIKIIFVYLFFLGLILLVNFIFAFTKYTFKLILFSIFFLFIVYNQYKKTHGKK